MKGSPGIGWRPGSVILCGLLAVVSFAHAGTYSGGSGTTEDPYRISAVADWQELIAASADWDKCFKLLNDIDFGGINLTPVAPDTLNDELGEFNGTPFTGVFEGGGHVLGNMVIFLPGQDYVGLFGFLGTGSQIRNLSVESITETFAFKGRYSVGGLCGANGSWLQEGGILINCHATGGVWGTSSVGVLCGYSNGAIRGCSAAGYSVGESDSFGGLCGMNGGVISDCFAISDTLSATLSNYPTSAGGLCGYNQSFILDSYATGSVRAYSFVGGLCGASSNYGISGCYATGRVSGTGEVGGLCGWNTAYLLSGCYATGPVSGSVSVGGLCGSNSGYLINDCYANGAVSGSVFVGGLCGQNYDIYRETYIDRCYATGTVSGERHVGGLVGLSYRDNPAGGILDAPELVQSSFWDLDTSGMAVSSGGTGKATAQMQTLATFTDAGWDSVGESTNGTADTWRMCGDGVDYPRLSWEFVRAADPACPDGVAMEDLLYLAQRWLAVGTATQLADLTRDGVVDMVDLAYLAQQWLIER